MIPSVNEGRTYGGGNGASINDAPTGPRRKTADTYRPSYDQERTAEGQHGASARVGEPQGSNFVSRSDMSARAARGAETATTSDNLASSTLPARPAARPLPARLLPATSESLVEQHFDRSGPGATRESEAPVNHADRHSQNVGGQVKGILKTTGEPAKTTAQINTGQNKTLGRSTEGSASASAGANPLAGQYVYPEGLKQLIKTLPKTLADLRAGKPASEAFQSRETSYLYKGDDGNGNNNLKDIPQLSVYFPLSDKKEKPHNPSECGKLCNGAPHVDRAPTCRFCLTRIAPEPKDQVSNADFDIALAQRMICTNTLKQLVFTPRTARECLDHLQTCSGIPNESDRKLLYNAFRKADERFIEDYHTSQWKTNFNIYPEAHHDRPFLSPKPRTRPQRQADTAPMRRKTSGDYSAPPPRQEPRKEVRQEGRQELRQQPYVPIAAKQLPNNPPPQLPKVAGHRRSDSSLSTPTSDHRRTASTSNVATTEDDAGWGVSANSRTYQEQLAADTISEKDELEEQQHDPEDDFTWQAVRDALKTAPNNDQQGQAASNPQQSDADLAMFFGAELIPTPHAAPQGPAYVPSRHLSVPPARPVSRNAYNNINASETTVPQESEQLDAAGDTDNSQSHDNDEFGTAPMDLASSNSSSTSGKAFSYQHENNLFRPATPPSSRQAKEEAPTPRLSAASKRKPSVETQDIPEPELPAEDPWDFVPEPGFEPFFAPPTAGSFTRSGAPSLESKLTSRNSSISPHPEVQHLEQRSNGAGASQPVKDTPKRGTSFVVEMPTPRRHASVEPFSVAPQDELAQQKNQEQSTSAQDDAGKVRTLQKKDKENSKDKTDKKAKKDKKDKTQDEGKAEKAVSTRPLLERSPSIECLNPIKPTSNGSHDRAQSNNINHHNTGASTITTGDSLFPNDEDDNDDDIPLRTTLSPQVRLFSDYQVTFDHLTDSCPSTQTRTSRDVEVPQVLEISSDEDVATQPTVATSRSRATSPIGPIARKTLKSDRKGEYKQRASSTQPCDVDDSSSSSSSDSDAPFVTSKRVEVYVPRARPVTSQQPTARKRGRPSATPTKPVKQKPPQNRTRLPMPPDSSDSDADSAAEEQDKAPTASQLATAARRFQRLAGRDQSPVRNAGPAKKKRKTAEVKRWDKDSSPSRMVRMNVDTHQDTPDTVEPRKGKAKVIETSDEEEDDDDEPSQSKRLKSWAERQAELASRAGSSTPRRSSAARSAPDDQLTAYYDEKPDLFFVDVQKNVDNVVSLPPELDPWVDIFEAAEILNLDTLRDCIGNSDNADEFVKWVLAVNSG